MCLGEETVYAVAEVIAFFDHSSPADTVDKILHCIGRGDAVFSRYNGIPKTLPGIVSDVNRLLFIFTVICHFLYIDEGDEYLGCFGVTRSCGIKNIMV